MKNYQDNLYFLILVVFTGTSVIICALILVIFKSQKNNFAHSEALQQQALHYKKQILEAVIHSQDELRKKIGQDLHDDVGSVLASLLLQVDTFAKNKILKAKTKDSDLEIRALVVESMKKVRVIAHELSPPTLDLFGLIDALQELIERINYPLPGFINLSTDGFHLSNAHAPSLTISVYRIIEELITNTLKHAKASNVQIILNNSSECIFIYYRDNGIGLDSVAKNTGMGFLNIKGRVEVLGGEIVLNNENSGFNCEIIIPIVQDTHTKVGI